MSDGPEIAGRATTELAGYLARIPAEGYQTVCERILAANRIVTYGAGREGLMMRAFTMRLMHLGFDAHCVADMTTPPVGRGDLVVVSCGPGKLAIAEAVIGVASQVGASTLVVTANPNGETVRQANEMVLLAGPTMNTELGVEAGALLMGSIFEAVQLIFYDTVCVLLADRLGQGREDSSSRHTNLE